jgi:hypothetical protein
LDSPLSRAAFQSLLGVREPRPALELVHLAVHLEKCLLLHIFGIFYAARDPQRQPEHPLFRGLE